MRLRVLIFVLYILGFGCEKNWRAEVTVHDSQKYSRTARPLLGRMSKIADAVGCALLRGAEHKLVQS